MVEQAKHEGGSRFEKKIHQTHFTVSKIELSDEEYESDYEWIRCGPGCMKLVRKKRNQVEIKKD
jgi:hypothetical protein